MSLEEIEAKVRERINDPISEIHIVGGIHPSLSFSYYLEMLTRIKALRPDVHIQAFTAVEIAHLAELAGKSISETLSILVEAGLGSLPGGGAEVFSSRIRDSLCAKKLPSADWLSVCQSAHRLGIKTNATMLYGHLETAEERVHHLLSLRQAQDETGGFLTFIPLAFHPKNTELDHLSGTTGLDDLKNIAVSRLMLDNFPHIKSFWIMIGPKMAQISLSFGADDIDGTVIEERITHMAGAETAQAMTREEILNLIREAGRDPVERDTLYNIKSAGKPH
jgi:aminodeoxyfutalosine synthase